MTTRIATCACGQLSVRCAGEPVSVSLCHCLECQKRTGSTYGVAAFFERSNVVTSGEVSDYSRQSDSGHAVLHHFCPRCGSTVFWEPARKPDVIAVAVGAFADPAFPAPSKSVYLEHRHHWMTAPDQVR
jgi:hypothetical protein